MKHLLLLWVLATTTATANPTVLARFSWQQVADAGRLTSGVVVTTSPGEKPVLKLENSGDTGLQATLLTIEQPKITTRFYAVSGRIRYEKVDGEGFLEMWSHFGDRGPYFSRTLSDFGMMAKLKGSSGWREVSLPFNASETNTSPSKLVVNLHLPGKGIVYLGDLTLVEGTSLSAVLQKPGAWWSDRAAGWIGGVAGTLIGCLSGLIGWLASRGRARSLVVAIAAVFIGLGVITLIAGVAAVLLKQPYGVWFTLLLLGLLLVAIFPFRLRQYRQHYRDLELRRMSSMDLVAG